MHKYRLLGRGDPAPLFTGRCTVNPEFKFDTVAGRFVVLAFLGTMQDEQAANAFKLVEELHRSFDDEKLAFFAVTVSPRDEATDRFKALARKYRFFLDFDGAISRSYGAAPADEAAGNTQVPYQRRWVVIDPMLRIVSVVPFQADGSDLRIIRETVAGLPALDRFTGFELHAPVLILPNLFEPELCDRLMELYRTHGGEESGFMREVDGKTVPAYDAQHKRRADYTIDDPELIQLLQGKVHRRVVPEIAKAHQFKITRMERYIIGCYDADSGGHFRAHRDNTTKGTAHRRFALSVNLNGDFDGGEVSFPEFGPRSFKPPPGGGVVFSCSLMHAVSKVTRGRRYAFLPFLYDEEAAKIRTANNQYLDERIGAYRA
jgi:peroxiredoxin/predicted 2-oxoglutarate/Fe(II)-dependent dioxygenase YbiX